MVKLFSVTGQPTPVGESRGESRIAVLFGNGMGGLDAGADGRSPKSVSVPLLFVPGSSQKNTVVLPHILERSGIAAGDLNGDGHPYLVDWAGDEVSMIAFDRSGPRQTISQRKGWDGTIKGAPSIVGVGDLDGDGRADLVGFDDNTQEVVFSKFDGKSFSQDATVDTSRSGLDGKISRVATGDVNGDGKADLVLVGKKNVSVGVNHSSSGQGIEIQSFSWGVSQSSVKFDPDEIQVGDVNRDGILDVVDVTLQVKSHHYVGTVTIVK
jgi:hypothetical protein